MRLPGKLLADIGGRPMIEHVYRRAQSARSIGSVVVATDDERIRKAVELFGGRAMMTRSTHRSGMERVAEVAELLDAPVVVNIQGDEPLVEPAMIDQLVQPFGTEREVKMATLRRRIDNRDDLLNPHIVKVVVDVDGNALYFSRAAIPAVRSSFSGATPPLAFKHIGLYAYRRDFLLGLASLAPAPLEVVESLEQLRALEHGYPIKVIETVFDSVGVDTQDDLDRVRRIMPAGAGV